MFNVCLSGWAKIQSNFSTAQVSESRALELDGIRGWASLSVMLFHVFWEMLGVVVPDLRNPVTYVFLNGNYAVMIFFVLSGDALSSSFFSTNKTNSIDRLVAKRYFRLAIPIFISCATIWLLLHFGLDFHKAAAVVVERQDWMDRFLQIETSFSQLLKYSFYSVFASQTIEHSFNPFLWTMSLEMVGSMLVFLMCYTWKAFRKPVFVLLAAAFIMFLLNSLLCLFFAGMFFSFARSRGVFVSLRKNKNFQIISLLSIFAIWTLMAGGWHFHSEKANGLAQAAPRTAAVKQVAASTTEKDVNEIVGAQKGGDLLQIIKMLTCIVLIFLMYSNNWFCRFFSGKFSVFLGKMSFSLYLAHFAVIISLMSYLLTSGFMESVDPIFRYLIIGVLSAGASFGVAMFFYWLEQPIQAWIEKNLRSYILQH